MINPVKLDVHTHTLASGHAYGTTREKLVATFDFLHRPLAFPIKLLYTILNGK